MAIGTSSMAAGTSASTVWVTSVRLGMPGAPFPAARIRVGSARRRRPPVSWTPHGGRSTRVSSGGGFGASFGLMIDRMITYPT